MNPQDREFLKANVKSLNAAKKEREEKLKQFKQREDTLRTLIEKERKRSRNVPATCRSAAQSYSYALDSQKRYSEMARKVDRRVQRERALLSLEPPQKIQVALDDVEKNLSRFLAMSSGMLRRLYDGLNTAVRNLIYWQEQLGEVEMTENEQEIFKRTQERVLRQYLLVNSFNPQLLANILGYQGRFREFLQSNAGDIASKSTTSALATPEANPMFWAYLHKFNFPHPKLWSYDPLPNDEVPRTALNFEQEINTSENPETLRYFNQEPYAGAYQQFIALQAEDAMMKDLVEAIGQTDVRVKNILTSNRPG